MNTTPDPITVNSKSNTCGEITSSNCVLYNGPAIPCISICKGASITDVIVALGVKVCSLLPATGGNWVDFSEGIATSGTGSNSSYTLAGFGSFSGESNFPVITTDNPMYKWTSGDNLKLRGALSVILTVSDVVGYSFVNLFTIPTTSFPSTWIKSQVVLAEVTLQQTDKYSSPPGEGGVNFMKAYVVANSSSGLVQLLLTFDFSNVTDPVSNTYAISLGGIELNLD